MCNTPLHPPPEHNPVTACRPCRGLDGRGCRLSQYQNGISGCASLLAGVLLLAVLVLEAKEAIITGSNLTVWIAALIISLYCLTKGVFTLFFYRKERRFEASVHQYAILSVHNQLFFLYERMLWLWLLLPILIGTAPTVIYLVLHNEWAFLPAVLAHCPHTPHCGLTA